MEYLKLKILKFHFQKKYLYLDIINFYFKCHACKKHFPKNWLMSQFNLISSLKIIFSEVKHSRKTPINQSPVISEPNIKKIINIFFGIASTFFIMSLKEKILRFFFALFGWF